MKKKFFKLFEIVSDGISRTLTLPTGDLLKNSKIVAVEAYNNASYGTKGVNLATVATVTDCYLKLVSMDGNTMIDNVPLDRLDPTNNNGNPWPLEIENINPSDCQIIIAAAAIPAAGQVFQIGFYYEKNYC